MPTTNQKLETGHKYISREEIRYNKSNYYKNVYEIYVVGGPDMVSGWEIKWVFATQKGIKSFPHFDEIITKNDMPHRSVRIINWI